VNDESIAGKNKRILVKPNLTGAGSECLGGFATGTSDNLLRIESDLETAAASLLIALTTAFAVLGTLDVTLDSVLGIALFKLDIEVKVDEDVDVDTAFAEPPLGLGDGD
jgi:hypothetical protein